MIDWFQITFGVLFLLSLVNLVVIGTYAKAVVDAQTQASFQPLYDALKNNQHFIAGVETARKERSIYMHVWAPLAWAAVFATLVVWVGGQQAFTQQTAVVMVIVLVPVIAKYWTHPIQIGWLLTWTAGMEVVIFALAVEKIKQRIAALEAVENPSEAESTELAQLQAALNRIMRTQSSLP